MIDATTSARPAAGLFVDELGTNHASWFLGCRTWERASALQTGGAFGMIEQVIEPGFTSPYHVHHSEDEAFYVIEGDVRFVSEGVSHVAGGGGFAFLPREIPHGFRVEGDSPARVLLLTTPGGFEGFVAELSEPAAPAGPPDMTRLMETATRYGVDILGPLPE